MSAPYRWDAVASLVVTALAIMGTPGPATISLTAAGSAYGMRRSLAYLAGIVAGTIAVLLAVATGITAALLALPAVRPVLIAAGAGYILWLAYHIATAPPLSERQGDLPAPGLAGGALLGVANPKAWIAIAAVFASARLADGTAADAAAKVAVLTAMIAKFPEGPTAVGEIRWVSGQILPADTVRLMLSSMHARNRRRAPSRIRI